MNTILVTGGAGSVGREVALALAARGHHVRAFDLPACDFGPLQAHRDIEIACGDIRDQDAIRQAVAGIDAVVHLAALLPPASERDRQATLEINAQGTANLVGAMAQANHEARLVLSSSVCVYGDTSAAAPPVRTTWPTRATDIYAESKIAAERAVMVARLPHVVLRVSGVSVPAFLEPPAIWPFQPEQRIEFICRTDVVSALVAAVEARSVTRRVWNIAGGPTWRMLGREYVAAFNAVWGLPPGEGRYLEHPGYFDWYDTAESQAALEYQQTPFPRFLELLEAAIEQALGGEEAP